MMNSEFFFNDLSISDLEVLANLSYNKCLLDFHQAILDEMDKRCREFAREWHAKVRITNG